MKIKKIAILTRRAGYNMGTSLQAVAMSRFIADAGYPNIIIDYDEYAGHLLWQLKPAVNRLILSVILYTFYKFTIISKYHLDHKTAWRVRDSKNRKIMNTLIICFIKCHIAENRLL